jgi:uncharacterized membrane protein
LLAALEVVLPLLIRAAVAAALVQLVVMVCQIPAPVATGVLALLTQLQGQLLVN